MYQALNHSDSNGFMIETVVSSTNTSAIITDLKRLTLYRILMHSKNSNGLTSSNINGSIATTATGTFTSINTHIILLQIQLYFQTLLIVQIDT